MLCLGSGELFLHNTVDAETQLYQMITITTIDKGTPPLSSMKKYNISVLDANDNPPLFTNTRYKGDLIYVLNNVSIIYTPHPPNKQHNHPHTPTHALARPTTHPPHTHTHSHPRNQPHIHPHTHPTTLTHAHTPTYPLNQVPTPTQPSTHIPTQPPTYTPTQTPTHNTNTATTFTHPTAIIPVFILLYLYVGFIEENKRGRTQLLSIQATDADVTSVNSAIVYSLVDTKGIFEVEPRSGVLVITKELDYEKEVIYKIIAQASDWKYTSEVPIEICVTNVNDNNPTFRNSHYRKTIAENSETGTVVLTVEATDPDPFGSLTYSIVSTEENLPFRIDTKSGIITVSGEVDREKTPTYSFQVLVRDGGQPMLNGTANIVITLSDVNDNKPVFQSDWLTVKIEENQNIETYITMVTATDKDIHLNGVVRYHIGDIGKNDFKINVNGTIVTKQAFDREVTSTLWITVFAVDLGSPALKSTNLSIQVIVLDENDNSPTWMQKTYSARIYENVPVGYHVMTVEAIDPDLKENGTVSYRIERSSSSPHFYVHNASGIVFVYMVKHVTLLCLIFCLHRIDDLFSVVVMQENAIAFKLTKKEKLQANLTRKNVKNVLFRRQPLRASLWPRTII